MKQPMPFAVAVAICCCTACNHATHTTPNAGVPDTVAVTFQDTVKQESLTYHVLDFPEVDLNDFHTDNEGWISLFDGKTFAGWRGYKRTDVPEAWVIDDGTIHIRKGSGPVEQGGIDGGDLVFAHKFKNFEFSFEWKVGLAANSGVFILVQEIAELRTASDSSPEYQILDNENHPNGQDSLTCSASLYGLIAANPQNALPYGQWNNGRIVCNNGHVEHYQNGELVLTYQLWSPEMAEMLKYTSFNPQHNPLGYHAQTHCGGSLHEGLIALQDHGEDVWYRNLHVRLLE